MNDEGRSFSLTKTFVLIADTGDTTILLAHCSKKCSGQILYNIMSAQSREIVRDAVFHEILLI